MKNNFSLIFILITATILFSFITKATLNTDKLILNSLADQFTQEQIFLILNYKKKWEWLSYAFIPLFLLIKTSIIAAILDVGCFFFGKEIKYKKLFNIVLKAEFVFLLVIVYKTAWFYLFQTDYNLEDLQYFYPLSALNIIGYEGLQPWFIYPFQVLNLFELAYWLILTYLLGKEINDTESTRGLQIVASSYGVGLLIWVVSVMFFSLNMS
ncbi:hypothetical protein [Winogradskyella sp.]|uniref:hypothetical protein n=1 Tax=Winogradskyella sp. TaxID=1883156 RepID=UPI0025E9D9F8|nr:hypothetical protein [Winogradskyella sp.]MBT8244550.1 hypothetical protein [Winogradskyella sp.]